MANTHLTSGDRLQVYQALFQLNRSFHFIIWRLTDLRRFRTFNSKTLADLSAFTQEMQLEINHHLLETLTQVEHNDWHNFGKVRAQREKQQRLAKGKREKRQ